MDDLDRFKETLRHALNLDDPMMVRSDQTCIRCRQPALPRCRTEAGRREYQISGFCEVCFDECFKEMDE